MRAISLWEPWGTAIAKGLKKIETRHWSTDYRGPIAIHCAKTTVATNALWSGADTWEQKAMLDALAEVGVTNPSHLAFGCVVAVCMLVRVVRVESLGGISATERIFGNYEAGRFGWMLENVRPLAPQPFRGAQGFFTVPDGLLV